MFVDCKQFANGMVIDKKIVVNKREILIIVIWLFVIKSQVDR